MLDRFSTEIREFATRSVRASSVCTSEESTKVFLVLPFFGVLGFDVTDPAVVVPEVDADFSATNKRRVDFAIMTAGQPSIAVEVKKVGTALFDARDQLRGYYNALQTARLGVATDGLVFEFFLDHAAANIMDAEPFLTVDLNAIANGRSDERILDALKFLRQEQFDPDTIADMAQAALLRQRLKTLVLDEFRSPSEDLCRTLLQRIGITRVRATRIGGYYRSIIKECMEEAVIVPVLSALRSFDASGSQDKDDDGRSHEASGKVETTSEELEIFDYVRRRLAFLSDDERAYEAISLISYRDYIGKFVIYLDRSRKGRLLELTCLGQESYRFAFPEIGKVVTTSDLKELDDPLREIFAIRLRELSRAA